jgi:hypothetical protein
VKRDGYESPAQDCDEIDDWETEIESLASGFLWDADFEYTEIPDMPPERAAAERESLGIDNDYFTALPPDPNDEEFDDLVDRIRKLCKDPVG